MIDDRVRFDPDMVIETIATAPSSFTLRARNPARDLMIGGDKIVFAAVGGPAFCSDLDRGRRPGTFAEQCDYLRIIQSLGIIHQEGGGPFEAMDLSPETRHLDLLAALTRLLDKNWQGIALGRERAADSIDIAAIALGTDRDGLAADPAVLAIVNTNSPLSLDIPMAEGLTELAEANQAVCITPFTLAGAMAPATLAGALTLMNAEVLAGVALTQLVRPGSPVMYGSFTSNVDMRSGSPAFGTPEYTKAAQAGGQLARRYRLPYRSSNTTTSNAVDAQAAYESQMSLWGAVAGGANLVNHAAGWLEGGLTASFEKLVIDAEMLQMMAEYLQPIVTDDDALGAGSDRRRRARRSLLRLATHDDPLRDGVLLATRVRLAQLRDMAARWCRRHGPSGQPDLEAVVGRVRTAASRSGDRRAAHGVRRPAQDRARLNPWLV